MNNMEDKSVESKHLISYQGLVSKADRRRVLNHESFILWFTGLSGSGKSTLSHALEKVFLDRRLVSYVLDGDNVRKGLNRDLYFSEEDRHENIRRISELSKLFVDAGVIVLSAFISPFCKDRDYCRSLVEANEFIEIYVDCSLDVCEGRDVKGLYKKARAGEITQFTGIDSPYEPPVNPEIVVGTAHVSVERCVDQIVTYLENRGLIPKI